MRNRWYLPLAAGLAIAPLTAGFLTPDRSAETEQRTEAAALLGLWQATTPEKEGDLVRFYYFHDGGIGLVRYGRMGLTYTRSFHWRLMGDRLGLVFTKSGSHHKLSFSLEEEGQVLHLEKDPVFPGNHRYRKDERPRGLDMSTEKHPLARLWIQPTRDRNGARGFRMYQLQAPTIDGRGVGWYHEGDMSEWSTETLTYRRTGGTIELFFPIRGERVSSRIAIEGTGSERRLTLFEDPRNYWHERAYADGGPGFTVALDGLPLPYHVPGHGAGRPLGSGVAGRETPSCLAH